MALPEGGAEGDAASASCGGGLWQRPLSLSRPSLPADFDLARPGPAGLRRDLDPRAVGGARAGLFVARHSGQG